MDELLGKSDTLTASRYLRGDESIPLPDERRQGKGALLLRNVTTNNLRGIDCKNSAGHPDLRNRRFRGPAKSSLVVDTLYKHLCAFAGSAR